MGLIHQIKEVKGVLKKSEKIKHAKKKTICLIILTKRIILKLLDKKKWRVLKICLI